MNRKHDRNRESFAIHEVYAFAHVESWLEAYARSHALPLHELTARVSDLLLANRAQPTSTALPTMRQTRARRGRPVEQVAMDDGSRSKLQRVKRKSSARAVHAYWAKMTPAQRSKEMQRRQAIAKERRAKAQAA